MILQRVSSDVYNRFITFLSSNSGPKIIFRRFINQKLYPVGILKDNFSFFFFSISKNKPSKNNKICCLRDFDQFNFQFLQ